MVLSRRCYSLIKVLALLLAAAHATEAGNRPFEQVAQPSPAPVPAPIPSVPGPMPIFPMPMGASPSPPKAVTTTTIIQPTTTTTTTTTNTIITPPPTNSNNAMPAMQPSTPMIAPAPASITDFAQPAFSRVASGHTGSVGTNTSTYTWTYTCTYTSTYTCTYTSTYASTYASTYTSTYTSSYSRTNTNSYSSSYSRTDPGSDDASTHASGHHATPNTSILITSTSTNASQNHWHGTDTNAREDKVAAHTGCHRQCAARTWQSSWQPGSFIGRLQVGRDTSHHSVRRRCHRWTGDARPCHRASASSSSNGWQGWQDVGIDHWYQGYCTSHNGTWQQAPGTTDDGATAGRKQNKCHPFSRCQDHANNSAYYQATCKGHLDDKLNVCSSHQELHPEQAMHAGKRASAKVYIDNSHNSRTATATADDAASSTADSNPANSSPPPQPSPKSRRRLMQRLSHDISTEQLFTDQLIDGKVADGEDDVDDDDDDDDGTKDTTTTELLLSTTEHNNHAGDDNERSHKPSRKPSSPHHHRHKSSSSSASSSSSNGSKSKSKSKSKTSTTSTLSSQHESPIEHDDKEPTALPTKMYRIESHSHLSSLDAKHLDKHDQQQSGAKATTTTSNRIALMPLLPQKPIDAATATATAPTLPATTTTVCDKCLSHKDMPPLHCAAYSGHVECLTLLLLETSTENGHVSSSTEEELLPSNQPSTSTATTATRPYFLDKKRRTPLFYSCAANRIDCCTLLLTQRQTWRDLPDKQLDTPVHVCCFFGWHACLEKLLTAGADPHGRNAKGFKPSHIAKTRECLELLLSYGDDLQQGDKLGRTPLFVACARDRSICVEFLCGWNHQTRSWMLEQEDHRGDRPIHAAACNGSHASLAILLRFGTDPFIQNAKQMTPRDLAIANSHDKCVELLASAELERTSATAWFAPANAVGLGFTSETNNNSTSVTTAATDSDTSAAPPMEDGSGWIECWDNASGMPFYYHNLSGKCQWEVPEGFQPHLLQLLQGTQNQNQTQYSNNSNEEYEDENGEYVWVKKKRQTVCVVTGKESEWTAVQDPASKAIYYKNTRTGQSQWEEPDAVQQLQSASAALASQQATRVWAELESSRTTLARALALEKQRQWNNQSAALEQFKLEIQRRKDDIRKKEEQAKLQQLLPRSSFIRRKKQSMMIKIKGASASTKPGVGASPGSALQLQEEATENDEDKMELICQREPSLDILLSTYVRLQGVRDLQLSVEKRFFNCLFHYYVAQVDPVSRSGLSKSQFRTVLREAAILPSSFTNASTNNNNNASYSSLQPHSHQPPTLKLHVVDLIFAQAARIEAMELSQTHAQGQALLAASSSFTGKASPHSASYASLVLSHRQAVAASGSSSGSGGGAATESQLGVVGFTAAMQIVRERMVALAEDHQSDPHHQQQQQPVEIDDDEEWFLTTFVLPLTVRLGGKMLTQIRECKELDLDVVASSKIQALLAQNRQGIQRLHRYYTTTAEDPAQLQPKQLKMLTFRGLSQCMLDFAIVPQYLSLPVLNQLYEAVNWISGHAHTEIISFEKFQQLLTIVAVHSVGRTSSAAAALAPIAPMQNGATQPLSAERESYLVETLVALFRHLESCPAVHRVAAGTQVAPLSVATGTSSSGSAVEPVARTSFFQLEAV